MIKVVYTYRTKTQDLEALFTKFKQSTDERFYTAIDHVRLEKFRRDVLDDTYIVLDIYYSSLEDFKIRKAFEEANPDWCEIWFNPLNKHEEVSVEVFEVI